MPQQILQLIGIIICNIAYNICIFWACVFIKRCYTNRLEGSEIDGIINLWFLQLSTLQD